MSMFLHCDHLGCSKQVALENPNLNNALPRGWTEFRYDEPVNTNQMKALDNAKKKIRVVKEHDNEFDAVISDMTLSLVEAGMPSMQVQPQMVSILGHLCPKHAISSTVFVKTEQTFAKSR